MTRRPKQAQSAIALQGSADPSLACVGQSPMQHGFSISHIGVCDLYTSAEENCTAVMYNMVLFLVLRPASQAQASQGLTSQLAAAAVCRQHVRQRFERPAKKVWQM